MGGEHGSWIDSWTPPPPKLEGLGVTFQLRQDKVLLAGCASEPTRIPVPVGVTVLTQPPSSAASGAALAPAPVVGLVDGTGARVAARGVTIVAALSSGTGTVSGTTEVRTDAAGEAAFADLRVVGPVGSKSLRFEAAGLASAATTSFQLGPGAATSLLVEAGNNQTAAAGTDLAVAPAVKLLDGAGNPVSGVPVAFAVTSGGGSMTGPTASTGSDGVARVGSWRLGTGVGANQATATAGALSVAFTATATVGAPAKLTVVDGNGQTTSIGDLTTTAPAVKLTDAFDNPVAGVAITFAASDGGLANGPVKQTDPGGIARVGGWVLGLVPGPQTMTASRTGVPSATINATAIDFAVAAISAGGLNTCARTAAGAAYCWGDNSVGQIGDSTAGGQDSVPVLVKSGAATFSQLAVGGGHVCGLTPAGAALCWGSDLSGQLGINTQTGASVNAPAAVVGGRIFVSIVAGDVHSCGLEASGAAWCWGNNGNGRLGDSTTQIRVVPTAVKNGIAFASLSAGAAHTCGLTAAGAAYCWGSNGGGRLGDGTTVERRAPTLVNAPGVVFTAIAAGGVHTCALTTAGTAMCWGTGTSGVLGTGSTGNQLLPIAVDGGGTYQAIAVGNIHSCAITTAGVVRCWGNNGNGRLGGTNSNISTVPIDVGLPFVAQAIDLGVDHSCARSQAGSAICWGRNGEGQIGDATVIDATRPTGVKRP
ncbi:MAG: hypothetical protein FJ206_17220 [Gemmatimonadetes bacterium]|nr:hypothetical protein [Gemmatimonadota bacterium]